jgi:hypothetical protein
VAAASPEPVRQTTPCVGYPDPAFPGVYNGHRCVFYGPWPTTPEGYEAFERKVMRVQARREVRLYVNRTPLPGTINGQWQPPLAGMWLTGAVGKIRVGDCQSMGPFGASDMRCPVKFVMKKNDGTCYRWSGAITEFPMANGGLQVYIGGLHHIKWRYHRSTGRKLGRVPPVPCPVVAARVASRGPRTRMQLDVALRQLADQHGWRPSGPSEVMSESRGRKGRRVTLMRLDTITSPCYAEARWLYRSRIGVTRLRWRPAVLGDAGGPFCGQSPPTTREARAAPSLVEAVGSTRRAVRGFVRSLVDDVLLNSYRWSQDDDGRRGPFCEARGTRQRCHGLVRFRVDEAPGWCRVRISVSRDGFDAPARLLNPVTCRVVGPDST